MRVLHIINGLGLGGAENALVNLLRAEPGRNRHVVVSLTGDGPFAPEPFGPRSRLRT